jgi:hypothetical protein
MRASLQHGYCGGPLGAALAALLAAAPASADDAERRPLSAAIELRDADCLNHPKLVAGIARYLHRDTIDARIHVSVRELAGGVTFTLSDGGRAWENTYPIERASCAERRSGIPLGIAMALDALVLAPVPPPPPPAPPAPVALPAPAPPKASPRPPAVPGPPPRPAPRRLGLTASLAIDGLFNVVPGVALGIAPTLDLRVAEPLDLRGAFLATSTSAVGLGSREADVGLLAGALSACLTRRGVVFRLRGCAGVVAGSARAEGSAFSPPSAIGPWAAALIGLDARWAFGERLGLVGSLEGYLPVVRPRIEVIEVASTRLEAARSFPTVGAALGFGPSVLFW